MSDIKVVLPEGWVFIAVEKEPFEALMSTIQSIVDGGADDLQAYWDAFAFEDLPTSFIARSPDSFGFTPTEDDE